MFTVFYFVLVTNKPESRNDVNFPPFKMVSPS